jgi:hypothetical protein
MPKFAKGNWVQSAVGSKGSFVGEVCAVLGVGRRYGGGGSATGENSNSSARQLCPLEKTTPAVCLCLESAGYLVRTLRAVKQELALNLVGERREVHG